MTVFISHRGSDSVVARNLADGLRDHGLEVWLDLDEVKPGDSIIARMNSGLSETDRLILLYSDDTTGGAWMDREWMSYLARQLDGEGVRIIPARIGHSTGPAILADLKYADLSKNWELGVQALVQVL